MRRADTANFFGLQDAARRTTRRLVLVYVGAVIAVALAVSAVAGMPYAALLVYWGAPLPDGSSIDYNHLLRSFFTAWVHGVPRAFYGWCAGGTFAVMLGATLWRSWQLREGGEAVAEMLGAMRLDRSFATPLQRRLLNVVEEMAIASGIAVPPVYVLQGERALNALVAGTTPNEAVVIVTQSALEDLTRDELQGVIGHEFSHILNGDMQLNLRLLGLLYGVVFIGQTGQYLLRMATAGAIGVAREKQTILVPQLFAGALLASVGYIGLMAARYIKAAIAHQREFLADAASVQFTRNPDGIAGALDSIRSLRRGSQVMSRHAEELSHMFFAQAVSTVLGPAFATHPPIDERIRRVRPFFNAAEYRRTRPGVHERTEVAVLDALGNVVKVIGAEGAAARPITALAAAAAVADRVGRPQREHLDAAAGMLAALPEATRRRMVVAAGAAQVMCALVLEREAAARALELGAIEARSGALERAEVEAAFSELGGLSRAFAFPLAGLALPVLKNQPQAARDAFVADLGALVEADRRVTLGEFVLLTFLRQHLREGAGRPIATRYRKLHDVLDDATLVLSLVAHAARGESAQAFALGAKWLDAEPTALTPVSTFTLARVGAALERLRVLAPLVKPRVLRACVDAAADGGFTLAQAELLRTIAATLDCPVPPVLETLDPATLAT
ncbi:MAG: M48 family metalloprotease [Betaproteobacteria bacterium]|nr:M48 family metalloprotease [Betaproteobacteria bacterium]